MIMSHESLPMGDHGNQLHGARLILRPVKREDIEAFVQWTTDPEVMKHVTNGQLFDVDQEHAWFEGLMRDPDERSFTMCLKDGTIIGSCGYKDIRNPESVELGILLGRKDQWGKGYGPEAMTLLSQFARDVLKVKRVWLRVDAAHASAVRAYEKAGFHLVETIQNPERIFSKEGEHIMEIRF
jgi:RimJ/RimL family protein N-acetyltransferase